MSVITFTAPNTAVTASDRWERYNERRASIEDRWPNVGIEDLRALMRLYDEACAALEAER